MTRPRTLLLWLPLALLAWALPAMAKPPGGPPGPHGGSRMERALEEVDLPAEVRKEVDALLDASHRTRRDIHRSLRREHAHMRELLEAAEPDEDAILAQAEEIGRLQTALEKDRLTTLLRIRERLSEDQRAVLTEVLRGHGGPPPHRRGRPPGPR